MRSLQKSPSLRFGSVSHASRLPVFQVGKEFGEYFSAYVRHHDDVGEVLRFVIDLQMHRREGILFDDRITGALEVNRV